MSSDLLFYILPREGKIPIAPEDKSVQKVSKDAVLRPLNDEEQELKAEDRDAKEKEERKRKKKKAAQVTQQEELEHKGVYEDEQGQTHFDDYA